MLADSLRQDRNVHVPEVVVAYAITSGSDVEAELDHVALPINITTTMVSADPAG
jgi:hypothetical protein